MSLLSPRLEAQDDKSSVSNLSGIEASAPSVPNAEVKAASKQSYLDVPLQSAFERTSDDLESLLSTYSADNENERHTGSLIGNPGPRPSSWSPRSAGAWQKKIRSFWALNRGLALVMVSQLFGALMNVTTRLLETGGKHGNGMHPFQILFARMGITLLLCLFYMWWRGIESAPFGPKPVRKLLVARGFGGFFGVYGVYYSLQYLPIADATVITFLAPSVACFACSVLIKEPFTRMEQIAAGVSLTGVILIARPTSLFQGHSDPDPIASGAADKALSTNATVSTDFQQLNDVSATQRLIAVGVALIGVLGAACAYTTIRWIGKRAHPLISVNYFAGWCTVVSLVAVFTIPGVGFRLPSSLQEWGYLLFLGICGFVMQIMLTAGLAHEKSSRATNMVYTQMLFALAFDKIVWNTTPGIWSIVGSSLILGSALYVAVNNEPTKGKKVGGGGREDEEVGLVAGEDQELEDITNERGPLRGVQEVQLRTMRV